MTGALLLLFVMPFLMAVGAIVANAEAITERLHALLTLELPPLPAWLERLPFVDERIAKAWHEFEGGGKLAQEIKPYVSGIVLGFASSVGSVGGLFLQFLLTVAVTALFYATGDRRRKRYGVRGASGGSPRGRGRAPRRPGDPGGSVS
jgi:predicted PurR-regulated permease PerM